MWKQKLESKIHHFLNRVFDSLVMPPGDKNRVGDKIFIAFLVIGGILLWGYFMDWGKGPLNFHDWSEITEPRLTFLKNALDGFHLPLHSDGELRLGENFTNQYLAIPDIILSPQIFLLWFMDINLFSLFQVLLLYLGGFWGLLKLRRKFSFSLLTFAIVFLLFNFNGHIVAHLSVGHLSFASYFLLPWLVYLVFDLVEGKANWKWIAKISLFFLLLILNGGYHLFIYCLFFLGLLAIFYPAHFWVLTKTVLLSVGVSMVRLLPEVSLIGSSTSHFMAGFANLQVILNSLIGIQYPEVSTDSGGFTIALGSHEVTFYLGIIGTIFLIYFGIIRHFMDKDLHKEDQWLILPLGCLSILTLDQVYRNFIFVLPVPIFYAERVSMRIFALILVFLLILAGRQFQKWLNQPKTAKIVILATMLLLIFELNDLWQNFRTWTVLASATAFDIQAFDPNLYQVNNNMGDTLYLTMIGAGLVTTLICSGFIGYKVFLERKVEKGIQ
jgi:hypothetical protein